MMINPVVSDGVRTVTNYYEDYSYTSEWWDECELVYWLPNRSGYTTDEDEAGIYSLEDLEECAGDGWDWIARPLTRSQLGRLNE